MTEELTALLDTARHAALTAGQALRDFYSRPRDVKQKGFRDFVTDADLAAQEIIVSIIRERHPTHHILAEEGSEGVAVPDGTAWVIDPVDGTTNYMLGVPVFCVSVGVARDRRPLAGAIYDPLRDELFSGVVGGGAALNGRPLARLRPIALEEAVVGMDWARADAERAKELAILNAMAHRCRTMRTLGLAYIAAGRVQLYFHPALWPWDVVAGAVLIGEVGGAVQQLSGAPWKFDCGEVVAGHPALLAAAQPLIEV